jgi:photosystem II stability/assembly factor-like uncharacterized protein
MGERHAQVETSLGTALVDVESAEVLELVDAAPLPRVTVDGLALPLLVAADCHGSRIVAVVNRRPPLVVSDDGGVTWREAGGGLPPGRAVAISPEHPDQILFVSAERIYLSEDGGRFWRSLELELIDIRAVAWEA